MIHQLMFQLLNDVTWSYTFNKNTVNESNQGGDLSFGENNNDRQIVLCKAYIVIDITLWKIRDNFNILDADGNIDELIRLVKTAFAYNFSIATLNTTRSEEKGVNKYFGHISIIMRKLLDKDGDILTYFDKIDVSQKRIKSS